MSEKYTIEIQNFLDGNKFTVIDTTNLNCRMAFFDKKENAELICRLLNEDEKRKILPKIDVDTDDMVSILGILENNISMILHLRPELGKTYNYDFVNRMKSKYYEKTRNLLGLE